MPTFSYSIKTSPSKTGAAPHVAGFDRAHLLESAAMLLEEGDAANAQPLYCFLLETNNHDAKALRGLGLCMLALNRPAQARSCFHALAGRDDDEDERHFLLGRCHFAEGNDAEGLTEFRRVERPETFPAPLALAYWRQMGECLRRLTSEDSVTRTENWEEAADCYRRALDIDDNDAKSRSGLGMIAYALGDFESAELHLLSALSRDPRNLLALQTLLAIALRAGEYALMREPLTAFFVDGTAQRRRALRACAHPLQRGRLDPMPIGARRNTPPRPPSR